MGSPRPPEFDAYADHYGKALDRGISISGEDKDFFARGRVAWLAAHRVKRSVRTDRILDFGCGTGSSTPFFLALMHPRDFVGIDISSKSLERARASYGSDRVLFKLIQDYQPMGDVDLAFCNGVFHHIPVHERDEAIDFIRRSLKPGGLFAFWENNPWNPGTRWIMNRIPFDREAVKLSAPQARQLLRSHGFEIVRTDFLFVFPRALGALRFLEPMLTFLPLGAQYLVLARKPDAPAS